MFHVYSRTFTRTVPVLWSVERGAPWCWSIERPVFKSCDHSGPIRGQYEDQSLSGKYLTIIYASIKLVFCHTEFYLCDPKDVIMNDNIKS